MKKLFVFFISLFISISLNAQDDYVNSEPLTNDEEPITKYSIRDFTNYTVNASAFTIDKGNNQLLGTDLIYGKASFGFSDKTMGSINLSLIGTFIASVKHRFNISQDLNFAVSACGGNGFYLNRDSIVRFAGGQAIFTIGDKQTNLTIGAGLYFGKSTFELVNQTDKLYFHNVFVATQRQLKRRTYLVAEGMYLWNYNTFLGSVAIKFLIKKRMSLHLGLMPMYRNGRIRQNQTRTEGGIIPVVSYRWLFSN